MILVFCVFSARHLVCFALLVKPPPISVLLGALDVMKWNLMRGSTHLHV